MLTSQTVPLQLGKRAVAIHCLVEVQRPCHKNTSTPNFRLKFSWWAGTTDWEAKGSCRFSPSLPPRFSLKTKQKVGVISVSYSMARALVSIRSEMRCVQEHQATAGLSQSSLVSQELFLRSLWSGTELPPDINPNTFDSPTVWRTWGQASCLGAHICCRITMLGRKPYNHPWTQFWRKKMSCV